MFPWAMAGVVFVGWVLAGVVWGVVWPLLAGTFTLPSAVRAGIGITAVGGVVTAIIVFFSIENRWRHELPQLFPAGDLSSVRGVPRLPVRARLLVVFLLTSVGPLALLGLVAWRRGRLAAADPANAGMMLGEMLAIIGFFIVAGPGGGVRRVWGGGGRAGPAPPPPPPPPNNIKRGRHPPAARPAV